MGRGVVLAALLFVGCLSTPPAAPCDADGDGFVVAECADGTTPADCDDTAAAVNVAAVDDCTTTVAEDCGGPLVCDEIIAPLGYTEPTVSGGALRVQFDPVQSWAPVDVASTAGSNQNLLFTSSSMNERLVGVNHWNNWHSWRPTQAPTVEVQSDGPAVFRMQVTWRTGPNGTSDVDMEGTSLYTIYPDGRFHRQESVNVITEHANSNVFLSAYIALTPTRIASVYSSVDMSTHTTDNLGMAIDGFFSGNATDVGYLCAYNSSSGDRVGWSHLHVSGQLGDAGPRATESEMSGAESHQVALQYDWARSTTVPVGTYAANLLMHIGVTDGGGDPCAQVGVLDRAFRTPGTITVQSPGTAITSGSGDDNADGYNEGGGYYDIDAGSAAAVSFSITRTLGGQPPSTAVRISNLEVSRPLWVSLGDGQPEILKRGRDYLLQPFADDSGGWLYLVRDLPSSTTLTVHTLP